MTAGKLTEGPDCSIRRESEDQGAIHQERLMCERAEQRSFHCAIKSFMFASRLLRAAWCGRLSHRESVSFTQDQGRLREDKGFLFTLVRVVETFCAIVKTGATK